MSSPHSISNPTVLYLAGQSHIGSTYLSRVLNQHPAIFCGGEMVFLHRRLAKDWECACQVGEDAADHCSFWPTVIRNLDEQGVYPEETTRLTRTRTMEWKAGLFLPRRARRKQRFMENNRAFFREVARASNSSVVLDCSKTPWRLLPLWQDAGLRVKVLHLMRNPRGQIASRMKYGHGFWHSAIIKYWRKNQVYRWMCRGSPDYLCVSFDRFLEEPHDTLDEIFRWLEVEPVDPFALPPADYHHLCGGWARQEEGVAPPKPALSRKAREFRPLQERFLTWLDRNLFPG